MRLALFVWLLLGLAAPASLWADALPEKQGGTDATEKARIVVNVSGVDGELLENVRGYLEILSFNGKPAPSRARVGYLHRAAPEQIKKALAPFAYFQPEIQSSLKEQDGVFHADYRIMPGPRVSIRTLDVQVSGEGKDDPEFQAAMNQSPLKPGAPLDQAAYEELKRRFQVLASQLGYFDAQLKEHEIRVDLPNQQADVTLHFETGRRYKLGEVSFEQPKEWIADSLLHRFVQIQPGQWYESSALQQLQGDLSNTDYYRNVEILASPAAVDVSEDLVIPVRVKLTPRNPRRYVLGAGYGTDTGVRVKAGVTGRRVNRRGHHYNAEALLAQIKYGLALEYIMPTGDPRTDSYGLRTSVEDEHSDVRNYRSFKLGGYYKYRDDLWVKTYALDYLVEEFDRGGDTPVSTLLIPSVDWTRTFPAELDKRIHPKSGTWLRLFLRGGADALLSDTNFLQPLVSAKWIHGFDSGSRVIVRGAVGSTWVDDYDALPTSLRYYAGGDRSVRGYGFSVISPRVDGEAVGGKNLTEASLEYEYPLKEKWSLATFVDVGDAYDDTPDFKTGAGFGIRWISPIGPVRIDFASGLDRPPGRNFRVHLTIGPDL